MEVREALECSSESSLRHSLERPNLEEPIKGHPSVCPEVIPIISPYRSHRYTHNPPIQMFMTLQMIHPACTCDLNFQTTGLGLLGWLTGTPNLACVTLPTSPQLPLNLTFISDSHNHLQVAHSKILRNILSSSISLKLHIKFISKFYQLCFQDPSKVPPLLTPPLLPPSLTWIVSDWFLACVPASSLSPVVSSLHSSLGDPVKAQLHLFSEHSSVSLCHSE